MCLLAGTDVSCGQDTCVFWPGHMCLLARTHVSSSQYACVHQPGHTCLPATTHVSSSQDQNCESRLWTKVGWKNENYLFYPSAESRRELKIKTSGVLFRGASAYYGQKFISLPKQAVRRIFHEKFADVNSRTKKLWKSFFAKSRGEKWKLSLLHLRQKS